MNTFIYGLFCPIENKIRYIGKSNNPKRRLKDHMYDFRTEYKKGRWIRSLKHQNLKPELVILDEIPIENWEFWEQWWIEYIKFIGLQLLNYNKGGNGLTIGNHKTFKVGNIPWNKKY